MPGASRRTGFGEKSQFTDSVLELFGPFGTVATRAMFGGHGIFLDNLMFALVLDDAIYFKADEINRAEFESAGWQRLVARRGGRRATYSLYAAPSDALESAESILPWARSAYAAAMRARARKVKTSGKDSRGKPGAKRRNSPRRVSR